MTQELIRRQTVVEICRQRDDALRTYGEAHDALVLAEQCVNLAKATASYVAGSGRNSYNVHSDDARRMFLRDLKVVERDEFMAEATRLTDIDVWSHIIEMTDLQRLMDKEAKDQLRQQPKELENPPLHFACR